MDQTTAFHSGSNSAKAVALIRGLYRKGVTMSVANGELRYRAPIGALSEEDRENLRASKYQILAIVERMSAPSADIELSRRVTSNRFPLSFSQLAHWQSNRLFERPNYRQLVSAVRISGVVDVGALKASLDAVLARHDALRTRIALSYEGPVQETCGSITLTPEIIDLRSSPGGVRAAELGRVVQRHLADRVLVTIGPLIGICLITLGEAENVLLVTMEHMISDGVSMNIFMRDVLSVYRAEIHGRCVDLPPVGAQFPQYSLWLRKSKPIQERATRLVESLSGRGRVQFPRDMVRFQGSRTGWGFVPFRITRQLKKALLQFCQEYRTTLVMSVFTAYVAAVLRWCDTNEGVFLYQSDGRTTPSVQEAIGFFASALYVDVALRRGDRFAELLERVTDAYCTAVERSPLGCIEALPEGPAFARNTCFNWVPAGEHVELAGLLPSAGVATSERLVIEHPMLQTLDRDSEPVTLLFDTKESVEGQVCFPRTLFSVTTMSRFARVFVGFIELLQSDPAAFISDVRIGDLRRPG